jgi:hypothetical protein
LTDRFTGTVAEYFFGSVIPRHDRTVQIFCNDCIVRGFDYGGKVRLRYV